MLGQNDLLAVHWQWPYKHARIQRIAMVSPILVQSSFESIQWWSRRCLFNSPNFNSPNSNYRVRIRVRNRVRVRVRDRVRVRVRDSVQRIEIRRIEKEPEQTPPHLVNYSTKWSNWRSGGRGLGLRLSPWPLGLLALASLLCDIMRDKTVYKILNRVTYIGFDASHATGQPLQSPPNIFWGQAYGFAPQIFSDNCSTHNGRNMRNNKIRHYTLRRDRVRQTCAFALLFFFCFLRARRVSCWYSAISL